MTTQAASQPDAAPRALTRDALQDRVLTGLVAVGIVLRLWQYLADTSLWFDELSLARNLSERSLGELLTRPLGYEQLAPLGFVALAKISTLLFGPSDMALRVVPFVCGLVALFLFRAVAERTLDGVAEPVAVGLFALAAPLIRYSAEFKQYGVDVAAMLALTLVAIDLRTRPPTLRRCLLAGAAGMVAIWFSQASVLVLAGLGAALTLAWLLDRTPAAGRTPVMVTAPMWAMAAVVGLLVARRYSTPQTLAGMRAFWGARDSFMPLPPRPATALFWAWGRLVEFFSAAADANFMLQYPLAPLYAALTLVGFGTIWRRRRDVALILGGPVVVTLAAAVVQQYPFRTRLVLFLVPTILLLLGAAANWVGQQAGRVHPALRTASVALLLAPPVYAVIRNPPPYVIESYKPVFAYVQNRYRAGDAVYVFANTYEAIDRYGPRFGLPVGSYVVGVCDPNDIRRYIVDVDRFRGAPRLWFISGNVPPFGPPRRAIQRYIGTIGVRVDSIVVPTRLGFDPVSAELFDLSDPRRLQSSSATAFPVDSMGRLHPRCLDFVRPTTPRSGLGH